MGMFSEFKEFINKGNMLGIAVGFVMGAAFTAVVTALVDNVIMPITAIPFGTPNFDSALILTINGAEIKFGAFLTALVTFVLIAVVDLLHRQGLREGLRPGGRGGKERGRPPH